MRKFISFLSRKYFTTHLTSAIQKLFRSYPDFQDKSIYIIDFTEAFKTATLLSKSYPRLAGQVQWKPGPLFAMAVSGNMRSHYTTLFSSSCSHPLFSLNSSPLPLFVLFSSLAHRLYAALACLANTLADRVTQQAIQAHLLL